ncbi:YbaB/EbfC family nucleoid-associated protein [Actinoplanes sp. NPDC049668]|uniref:YbaB/EbfC family nucleoid-associated protein n=1 Tax=unclassified Actinoplanes TaxID=2626549 RepID=UPI0033B4DD1D
MADRDANHALRARLDDVYGQYHRLRSGMDDMQRQLAELRVSAESDDGLILATVGPRGELLDLRLDPRIYRDLDADALARKIVATVERAAAKTSAQVEELVAGCLPADSGPMRYVRDNDFGSLLRRQDAIMREADRDA